MPKDTNDDDPLDQIEEDLRAADKALDANEGAWAELFMNQCDTLLDGRLACRTNATGDEDDDQTTKEDDTAFGDWLERKRFTKHAGKKNKDNRAARLDIARLYREDPDNVMALLRSTENRNPRVVLKQLMRELPADAVSKVFPDKATIDDTTEQGNGDDADDTSEAGADGSDESNEVPGRVYEAIGYDNCDPCVHPTNALVSIGYSWSTPDEFKKWKASLDDEAREMLNSVNIFDALIELAEEFEPDPAAKA